MAILIGSLLSPLDLKPDGNNNGNEGGKGSTSVKWGQGGKRPEGWKSLYTQGFYNLNKGIVFLDSPPKDRKELEEVRMVSQGLAKFRVDLVSSIFGEDAFEMYKNTRTDKNLISALPRDKQEIVEEIRSLLVQQ